MAVDSRSAIIIDNGSQTIKVGFGGEDSPRISIPSVVGRPNPEVRL